MDLAPNWVPFIHEGLYLDPDNVFLFKIFHILKYIIFYLIVLLATYLHVDVLFNVFTWFSDETWARMGKISAWLKLIEIGIRPNTKFFEVANLIGKCKNVVFAMLFWS